jgi:hypothetical protein
VITAEDMPAVMTGGDATISVTLSEASTVTADVTALNEDMPMLTLMDADGDGEGLIYTGTVPVTAEGDEDVTITINARRRRCCW